MSARLPMPFSNPSTYRGHSGVDFGQRGGAPIFASGPGVIARHSTSPSGGHWIVIRYDGIGEVGYAHLNDWTGCPEPGARVKLGDLIGYVGWDGHVVPPGRAGAHVHVTKISNQTYAATAALFDMTRWVGMPALTGKPKPLPTPKPPTPPKPAPKPEEDEDDMPIIIRNTENKEVSMLDPDIGADLPRAMPGKAAEYRSEKTPNGVVNVYRGFMVTTDKAIAEAWGRSYARAHGNAPQDRAPADYVIAQQEASRLASERTK